MISYIRGPLEEKREDSVVVEAGNIGYRIFIPSSVLGELPGLGEEVKIYTYFSVREDGMSLFGFLSRQDLEMFRQLIGVNGVGPKTYYLQVQIWRRARKRISLEWRKLEKRLWKRLRPSVIPRPRRRPQ